MFDCAFLTNLRATGEWRFANITNLSCSTANLHKHHQVPTHKPLIYSNGTLSVSTFFVCWKTTNWIPSQQQQQRSCIPSPVLILTVSSPSALLYPSSKLLIITRSKQANSCQSNHLNKHQKLYTHEKVPLQKPGHHQQSVTTRHRLKLSPQWEKKASI